MSVPVSENQKNQGWVLFGWRALKTLFAKTKSSGRSTKLSFGDLFNADERFNNGLASTGFPKTYNHSSLTPLFY